MNKRTIGLEVTDMKIAEIYVNGVTAVASRVKKIPKGIIGATVKVTFANEWADLAKTAVFQGVVTKDVLVDGNSITIPAECVDKSGYRLRVGFYGVADETLAIPTIWTELGTIRDATDPSGDTSTDPTLPVWAQLQDQVDNITATTDEQIQEAIDKYLEENPVVGTPGKDGTSPVVTVTAIDGGHRITITDANGTKTMDVLDGADGKNGTDGKDGADGQPGKDGTSATHSWNGTVLTITSASGTSSANLKGDKGDKGDTGPQGVPGEKGETGAKGDKGDKGDQGEQGVQGIQGIQGIQGEQGPRGEKGDPFYIAKVYASVSAMNSGYASDAVPVGGFVVIETGNVNDADNAKLFIKGNSSYEFLTDLSGAQGVQGPQGETGIQGPKGDQGEQGIQGIQGPQGEPGAKGDKGDKGDTGSAGTNGKDGKDGTSVTVKSVSESSADGGSNVVTFSDGKALTVKNGKTGAAGKTAYQYAQDGGYTGTETEFAAKLAGGASALQTFIDNTDVDYAYDAATGVNYTVIRVYRDKIDGTKQFPFVHHDQRKSTYDLVMEHGFCLAINAGVFNTTTGAADGIVIENGEVLQDGETTTHPQCLPLTIDANGNLSYASYNASAVELAANGIVSAVTGFMPIIIDYQEYAQANWNSVAHYTENAQRQIIGQFGNGDYAIVTCEGRNHQNSDGWTIAEAQTVCKRLGLKFAYNLDGGGSTETMLGYKHLNTIYDGTTGRKVPTFIVFTGSTSIDVTPGEVPETFEEVEYIQTSGDAYIRTDITEAATPFDYEAKILSTIDQSNITTQNNGNGHLFSATNTWYPFFKLKETSGEVIRRINGTENSSGAYTSFAANKWYVLSSTQADGSNTTTFFDVAANKSLYTSTKVNGTTYDTSKTFCICAYGADAGQKRLRFFGKLSYIKLSLNGELVHHFVAAKSSKTGVYGLLDKVTGVFHRSTSGTDFTGA